MPLTEFLILRKPCSGCLEERTPLIQPIANSFAPSQGEQWVTVLRPAQLNLGDCFAYAMAKNHGTALLFKGEDLDKTDIPAAAPRRRGRRPRRSANSGFPPIL